MRFEAQHIGSGFEAERGRLSSCVVAVYLWASYFWRAICSLGYPMMIASSAQDLVYLQLSP
eukprot:5352891-Amphidinium_carterae.1